MKLHTALALLTLALTTAPALAQVPPPVSPAPVVKLEYDAQGNPTRTVLAPNVPGLGLATSHSYDRLHRRRDTTDARAGVTRLDYNGRDDVTQVSDPRNLLTQYPRNGLGDSTGLVSPDTGTATHTYDAAGNLKTRLDSRGALATHTYDVLNRLTSVVYTQPGQANQLHSWFYDQTGPAFGYGVGRLTSTSYTYGSAWYGYDAQGRLTTLTQQASNFAGAPLSLTTTYGYDAAGHVVSITYPSGRVVLTSHVGGLPASISMAQTAGASPVALLGQIQHEPFGAVSAWQWQFDTGPRAHQRVFDSSGRMVRYTLGGAVRDISYDAADRISSYTHRDLVSGAATPATTALNQSFAYDELGRLLQVSSTAGNWTYGYDANGNRVLASSPGAGTRVYTVAADSNRLLALSNPARSLSHDEAGNGTYDNENLGSRAWLAGYNPAGRMHYLNGYSAGWNNATYQSYYYNTQGQRVAKWSHFQPLPSLGTAFMYDQQGQMLGEYNISTGAAKREYIWLQGMPVAVIAYDLATASDPAPVFFIQTDHLDTPRVVLDRNGAQRWSWVALPFGDGSPVTNPVGLGEFELNLRMPGQYFDKESGLSQNWHRDYDAGVGRYTQSDPIGLAGGINTYAYVGGNPISRVDPMGLYTEVIVWNGVGIGPSAAGHVSTNINGANYSFGPGGWDRTYPSAGAYAARQQSFRSGSGTVLGLSPVQEAALAQCLKGSGGDYSSTSNNCGTSIQSCLAKVGVNVGNSMLPADISRGLSGSPAAIGGTYYPGPSQFAPMPVVP